MSVFYALLDPGTGRLEYVSAGHPFPLLRRADGRIEELGEGGLPLGIREPLPYRPGETTLEPATSSSSIPMASPRRPGRGTAKPSATSGCSSWWEGAASPSSPRRHPHRFDGHVAGEPLLDDLTLVVVARLATPTTSEASPAS